MREKHLILLIFLLSVIILSCTDKKPNPNIEKINAIIKEIQSAYAPDRRTERFDVQVIDTANQIIIKGVSTNEKALSEFKEKMNLAGFSYRDSLIQLPTNEVKEKTGVAINSVSNLRSSKGDASEMASQALLGTPLRILQREGNWYLVQTPDNYIGWMYGSEFVSLDNEAFEKWLSMPKVIFTATYGHSFTTTSQEQVITDLVAGDILALLQEEQGFYKVFYPDGRTAYVSKNQAQPYNKWLTNLKISQESLVATSKELLGVPYLWGGTSTKGVDCSGFTKTVYFLNGMVIPRDASQQVHEGLLVDDKKDFSRLQPGDLLFFGRITPEGKEKVVHVGMWIGNNEYIHASGRVRINSVDSLAPNYDEYNLKRYLRAKRYLKNHSTGIQYLQEKSLYLK